MNTTITATDSQEEPKPSNRRVKLNRDRQMFLHPSGARVDSKGQVYFYHTDGSLRKCK